MEKHTEFGLSNPDEIHFCLQFEGLSRQTMYRGIWWQSLEANRSNNGFLNEFKFV